MAVKDRRAKQREYMASRRADARKNGVILESDKWASKNKEKHRSKTARWRELNPEKSAEMCRCNQKTRRSTPWGQITNRMWPSLHQGIKRNSTAMGKYNEILGYSWSDLKKHLGSMFDEFMTWDNWGEYWELDHIKPISSFRYRSTDDKEFLFCWSLGNLRPLKKELNQSKGVN